ncbi:hypothetical protein Bbelb_124430 [Branchiostoma belcheri]|nr:hypothetical protein Bbelb_124430 [Branchiostoma belcheri]
MSTRCSLPDTIVDVNEAFISRWLAIPKVGGLEQILRDGVDAVTKRRLWTLDFFQSPLAIWAFKDQRQRNKAPEAAHVDSLNSSPGLVQRPSRSENGGARRRCGVVLDLLCFAGCISDDWTTVEQVPRCPDDRELAWSLHLGVVATAAQLKLSCALPTSVNDSQSPQSVLSLANSARKEGGMKAAATDVFPPAGTHTRRRTERQTRPVARMWRRASNRLRRLLLLYGIAWLRLQAAVARLLYSHVRVFPGDKSTQGVRSEEWGDVLRSGKPCSTINPAACRDRGDKHARATNTPTGYGLREQIYGSPLNIKRILLFDHCR